VTIAFLRPWLYLVSHFSKIRFPSVYDRCQIDIKKKLNTQRIKNNKTTHTNMNRVRRSVRLIVNRKDSDDTSSATVIPRLKRSNSVIVPMKRRNSTAVNCDSESEPQILSLNLAGAGGVGKTSLATQFVEHTFLVDYDPTIEEQYRRYCIVDETPYLLNITDTAGQEEYATLRDVSFREGQIFLLVFSLADEHSFCELNSIYDRILKIKKLSKNQLSGIVVGNKLDLTEERVVSKESASKWAKERGLAYIESSAQLRTNVDEAFQEAVRHMNRQEQWRRQTIALQDNSSFRVQKEKSCTVM
jgi:small GTP-binding protein